MNGCKFTIRVIRTWRHVTEMELHCVIMNREVSRCFTNRVAWYWCYTITCHQRKKKCKQDHLMKMKISVNYVDKENVEKIYYVSDAIKVWIFTFRSVTLQENMMNLRNNKEKQLKKIVQLCVWRKFVLIKLANIKERR